MNNEEKKKMENATELACDAVVEIIKNDCQSAMNLYN